MFKNFYSIKVSVTVAVSKIWTNIDFSMITASNVNINDSFGILKSRAFWYMCFWSDQQPFLIILREKAKHNLTKESAFRMEMDLKSQASFKLTFVSLHLIKYSSQWMRVSNSSWLEDSKTVIDVYIWCSNHGENNSLYGFCWPPL